MNIISSFLFHWKRTKTTWMVRSIRKFRSSSLFLESSKSINAETPSSSVISDKLQQHISYLINESLHSKFSDPAVIDNLRAKFVEYVLTSDSYSYSNAAVFQGGDSIARSIRHSTADDLMKILSNEKEIEDILLQSSKRYHAKLEVFHTITDHHQEISKYSWDKVVEDTEALEKYSVAATSMGSRTWVMEGNDRMINFIFKYFKHGAARKHYLRLHSKVQSNKLPYADYSKDIIAELDPHGPQKIKVLDVGSCYNPFIHHPLASEHFDITAIDLFPADLSVLQCDFLNLEIGPKGSSPIILLDPNNPNQKIIKQLPANSYDAITMSLVLSYISNPNQREIMISKARQLLRTSLDTGIPHFNGLLLIIEKSSAFTKMKPKSMQQPTGVEDNNHNNHHDDDQDPMPTDLNINSNNFLYSEWKRCIASLGFDFTKYSLVQSSDGSHKSHFFVFSTKPIEDLESFTKQEQHQNLVNFGFTPRMWIRRDFFQTIFQSSSSSSASSSSSDSIENPDLSQIPEQFIQGESDHIKPLHLFYPIGIIGGGLGGSALALALQKKGVSFKLFEKDSSFDARRQGYALTMQQGGVALRDLDVVDEVKAHGVISTGHYSYDAQGNVLGCYGHHVPSSENKHNPPSICSRSRSKLHRELIPNATSSTDADEEIEDMEKQEKNANSFDLKQRHNIHIPRQLLRNIILQKVKPEFIHWNKKLVSMQPINTTSTDTAAIEEELKMTKKKKIVLGREIIYDRNPIRLRFDDGTEELCSIVIGADGIFSRVRQVLKETFVQNKSHLIQHQQQSIIVKSCDPNDTEIIRKQKEIIEKNDLNYLDLMVVLGICPLRSILTDGSNYVQRQWLNGSTRVFSMPFDKDHLMWQLSYPLEESRALLLSSVEKRSNSDIQECGRLLKEEALLRCNQWDPVLINMLEKTSEETISGHPVYDRETSDFLIENPLFSSRVTLIGDAAHPMSPFKGQGANQALLDALHLSKMLISSEFTSNKKRKIYVALRDFEKDMIQRNEIKVLKSREAARFLHSELGLAAGNITRAKAAEIFAGSHEK